MFVDGVSLSDGRFEWVHRDTSEPLPSYEDDSVEVRRPGRDGEGIVPTTTGAVFYRLVVQTPRAHFETLLALLKYGRMLSWGDGREARFVFQSNTPVGYGPADALIDVTFVVKVPGAFWRDREASTVSAPLGALSVPVPVFADMSAPVQDGVIRVKGAATGIQITDASGAWLTLPDVAAGEFVRFDMDTGRAWRTITDTWAGGTEVSGLVNFGGPRGVFEITPSFTDPNDRAGELTVTTASRSGAVVDVRGKAAYLT